MKILEDIIEEHLENEEELKKLPIVGDVIEISERDTSSYRGAVKEKKGQFEVMQNLTDSKLILMTHVDLKYKECFSYSDLMFDDNISWEYAAN